jgi:hypothetical protein
LETTLSTYPSAGFIWSEAVRQINNQLDQGKQIEGKANLLAGFTGVVATNLLTAATHPWLITIQMGLVIATFFCGYRALHTRIYATSLDLGWMTNNLIESEENEARFTMIRSAETWINQNDKALDAKARALDWELNFFMISVGMIIFGKLIT